MGAKVPPFALPFTSPNGLGTMNCEARTTSVNAKIMKKIRLPTPQDFSPLITKPLKF